MQLRYARDAGDASCPDEAALRAQVVERLGYDPFRDDAPTAIVATIRRGPTGRRAETRLYDGAGRELGVRQLSSPHDDCVEIASAMALAISVAIDQIALARSIATVPAAAATPPQPPPAPPLPPPPATPRTATTAPAPRPQPASAFRDLGLDAQLGVLATTGFGPGPTCGATLGVRVSHGALSIAIAARVDLPQAVAFRDGIVVALPIAGDIEPCLRLGRVALCLLGTFGVRRAWASGYAAANLVLDSPLVAFGARLGWEHPIGGRFALRWRADAQLVTSQLALWIDGEVAWRSPPLTASVGVDLVLRLR